MAANGGWHRAAARGEIGPGEALGVKLGGVEVALVELDGEVHAFGDVCPHAYALLSQGYLEGGQIECPLHAARFDIRTGKCLEGPVGDPVPVFEVKIEAGDVWVRITTSPPR